MGLLPCCPLCGARSIIAFHEHYFVFRRISATPLSAAFDCCSTLPRPLTEPMWGKVGAKWGLMADFRQSPARSEPRDRAKVLGAALVVGPGSASGSVRGGDVRPRPCQSWRAALELSLAPEWLSLAQTAVSNKRWPALSQCTQGLATLITRPLQVFLLFLKYRMPFPQVDVTHVTSPDKE